MTDRIVAVVVALVLVAIVSLVTWRARRRAEDGAVDAEEYDR